MINEIEGIIESDTLEITAVIESNTLEIDVEVAGSGPRGVQGFSAYELAVQQGFEGTEEEWLASLKGERGEDYLLTDDDRQEIADIVIADLDIKKLTWENIENKPNDIVYDAEYVHTDENYTDEEKSKLAGISNNAEVNTVESISVNNEPIESDEDKNVNIIIDWEIVADKPDGLVIDEGYVHTSNDFTDENKSKLDGIEAGAEINVLESINVNGNPLSIANKKVDITIPTKTSDLTNDDGFATESFVNSSIGTNTAYYISDDGEPFESFEALEAYSGEVTNNDYAFVVGQDDAGNVTYTRYKYNADNQEWAKEYVLNNSSFTDKQWQSINSEITASKVTQITTNKNDISNLVDTKMEYAILSFDGSHLKLDGVQKTFAEIKELCLNKKNFTYLLYSNRLYIPQYINENNVWFEASYIDNNIPYMHRIGINSRDAISVTTKSLAVKSDMDTAKESIETLESNVETLSTTIEQKADKSEIPDTIVTDVQINSASIVSDGVAVVPNGAVNTKGAVGIQNCKGIIATNGLLAIDNDARYTEVTMAKRYNSGSFGYQVIATNNYDVAVKLAMCDGQGAAWTAQEQEAAQIRLGILSSEGVEF